MSSWCNSDPESEPLELESCSTGLDLLRMLCVIVTLILLEPLICLWRALRSTIARSGSALILHLRKKLLCWTAGFLYNWESQWFSLADHILARHLCFVAIFLDKRVSKLNWSKWAYWEGRSPIPIVYSLINTLLISCGFMPWSVWCKQWFLSIQSFHTIIQILLCRIPIYLEAEVFTLIWTM